MQERYRTDYDGEFVVLNTYYKDGKKIQDREWIANPIENQYVSARAAIIGNGSSRQHFNIKNIENHRGGLLGKKSLQTYGSQGCWQELRCDFYVESDPSALRQIIKHRYFEKSAVYTGVKNCIAYPGKFYLTPYNVKLHTTACGMYTAAFDGHREIFLLGVDTLDVGGNISTQLYNDVKRVIGAYSDTSFNFVSDWQPHKELQIFSNVNFMTYKEFISYCDV